MSFKVTSLNVKVLNHPGKQYSLWAVAAKLQSEILCLQETHFCKHKVPSMTHKRFPHLYFANATNKKKGVLIAIKDTVSFKTLDVELDGQGRYIILICEINNQTYTIVNLYAPNSKQMTLFHKLWKRIQKKKQGHTLLCGDFNLAPDPSIDTQSPKATKHCSSPLSSFLQPNSIYDIFRFHHPRKILHLFFQTPLFFLQNPFIPWRQISTPRCHGIRDSLHHLVWPRPYFHTNWR